MASRLTTVIVVFIVAATFIAGIITRAQRDDEGPIDLIVFNGNVYAGPGVFAEAVAVRGNTIVRVGSNREIKRLRRPQTTVIDAHGGAVVPGFNDAHVHFLDGSLQLMQLDSTMADAAARLAALRAGIDEAHKLGITSIQNAGGTPGDIELWTAMRRDKALRVRVYQSLTARLDFSQADLDRLEDARRQFGDDPLFKTGSVEIVMEAAAAPSRNRLRDSRGAQNRLNSLVTSLDRRGWQIWIRADNEDALRMALDAFAAAADANSPLARGRRHRLEYAGTINAADIRRMSDLGVIASLQATAGDALGPEPDHVPVAYASAAERTDPRSAVAALGGKVVLGSDWPVMTTTLDPRPRLQWMAKEHSEGDAVASEATVPVPLAAAIDASTSDAAYASYDEQRKGTLARGMLADIVILSADIFATPIDQLMDVRVEKTIFDGEVVYSRTSSD